MIEQDILEEMVRAIGRLAAHNAALLMRIRNLMELSGISPAKIQEMEESFQAFIKSDEGAAVLEKEVANILNDIQLFSHRRSEPKFYS